MNELLTSSAEILIGAEYVVERVPAPNGEALVFENGVCLGFLFAYDTATDLIRNWSEDSAVVIGRYGLALRRAEDKAWNAYLVLVSNGEKSDEAQAALYDIEENLVGTRKVARDGVGTEIDLRMALLPLLPLQSAPKLDAVDMSHEIRVRASELSKASIDAFLSSADESVVLQIIEELQ